MFKETIGEFQVFFDGACEPINPGGAMGYGVAVFQGIRKVWTHSGMVPPHSSNSNNVAEYLALEAALDWFARHDLFDVPIMVFGDSNLVIRQMFGTWRIRQGCYAETARRCKEKLRAFNALDGAWIPRRENTAADDLSKAALRKAGVAFATAGVGIAGPAEGLSAELSGCPACATVSMGMTPAALSLAEDWFFA